MSIRKIREKVMHGKCENCLREDRGLRMHHMVPRHLMGGDGAFNRIALCSLCERFLHFRHSNEELKRRFYAAEKITGNAEMKKFGEYVRAHPTMRGKSAKIMAMVHRDFRMWKKGVNAQKEEIGYETERRDKDSTVCAEDGHFGGEPAEVSDAQKEEMK